MKARCSNPNNLKYHRYGGRGIKVSEEWENSFRVFYSDMGSRPSAKHSLERVDNDRGYCKENCTWATILEQARNKGKSSSNTSGVTGVSREGGNKCPVFRAHWMNLEGKKGSKAFSVNKYGYKEAFNLACKTRVEAISNLNKIGAGYKDGHGK
jgi:hypothetical protein